MFAKTARLTVAALLMALAAPTFAAAEGLRLGESIAPGVRFLVIQPASWNLPQPPKGEAYVEARGKLYRINVGTRTVTRMVDPFDTATH